MDGYWASFSKRKSILKFEKQFKDDFCFWMRCVAKLTNQRPVIMKLRLRKNNIIADKNEEKFLTIFLGFPQGLLIRRRRLRYR